MQRAIRQDGEQPGVLRMFLQHFGQEARTQGLVRAADHGYAPQPKQQLRGTGDLVVQILGQSVSAGRQLLLRQVQRGGSLLHQQPHHGQYGQQRSRQHQPQNARAQAHAGLMSDRRQRAFAALLADMLAFVVAAGMGARASGGRWILFLIVPCLADLSAPARQSTGRPRNQAPRPRAARMRSGLKPSCGWPCTSISGVPAARWASNSARQAGSCSIRHSL